MDLEGKWKAILIGGGISGLASLLPVLHLACCLIPLACAILSVAIYSGASPRPPLTNADGFVLGAMTGMIGTAVYAALIIPLTFLMGNFVGGLLGHLIPNPAEMPYGLRPILQSVLDHFGSVLSVILILKILGQLAVFVLFGSLGGVLGAALFRSRPASNQ
jgi:hypothetical protein